MEKIIKEEQEPLNVTTEQQKEGRAPNVTCVYRVQQSKMYFITLLLK